MADFVDQKKAEMESRLNELRPLVEEYDRLGAAVAALSSVGNGSSRRGATTKRAAKKPVRRSSTGTGTGSGRRGRPKGSGVRDKQALELVTATPGVTIPEIAKAMGIKQNYLYRVLPSLEKKGLVRKKGRGWYPR
jgi:Winged helix-turn-helix DNA-binding